MSASGCLGTCVLATDASTLGSLSAGIAVGGEGGDLRWESLQSTTREEEGGGGEIQQWQWQEDKGIVAMTTITWGCRRAKVVLRRDDEVTAMFDGTSWQQEPLLC